MKKGVALVTVILVTAFLLVIGGLTAFLVQRGLRITGISRRALSTFEAAEGGVELGVNEIWAAENEGRAMNVINQVIGGKEVSSRPQRLFAITEKGGSLEFAAAYEGLGRGVGGGGAALFYGILSRAEEDLRIESNWRSYIGEFLEL